MDDTSLAVVYLPEAQGAWISTDGLYRYALWRCWDASLLPLVVVMCNPSTADASEDDATIRKVKGFAQRLGFGGICVVNLYALRSRDPKALRLAVVPNGDRNNEALRLAFELGARHAGDVFVAWGAVAREHGPHYEDQACHLSILAEAVGVRLLTLSLAKDGKTPSHPLMLAYANIPTPWAWDLTTICRDCA